ADVTDVSAGGRHTCAVATGGTVECWGANDWKQLGNGLRQAQTRPRRVEGLAGAATAVAAGDNHTCALTNSGRVRCWGANDSGQLGDGTFRAHRRPVAVRGLRDAVAVSAGGDH